MKVLGLSAILFSLPRDPSSSVYNEEQLILQHVAVPTPKALTVIGAEDKAQGRVSNATVHLLYCYPFAITHHAAFFCDVNCFVSKGESERTIFVAQRAAYTRGWRR
jgi:hypothetical protein